MYVHIYRLTRLKGENSFYRTYCRRTSGKLARRSITMKLDGKVEERERVRWWMFSFTVSCFASSNLLVNQSFGCIQRSSSLLPTPSSSRQFKILFFKILSSPLCVMISLVTIVLQCVLFARIYLYSQPRLALDLQTPTISTIILYLRSYIIHALRTIFLSLSLPFRLLLTLTINYPTYCILSCSLKFSPVCLFPMFFFSLLL